MFLTLRREDKSGPATPLIQTQDATYLQLSNDRLQIQLNKRHSFPKTYCQRLDNERFQLGYGNVNASIDEEFLKITVQDDGTITIERDILATLPIFYGYSEGVFMLCNEYAPVVEAMPRLTLNPDDVVLTIAPRRFHRPTLWHEVSMLRGGETLHIDSNRPPTCAMLHARAWESNDEIPESNPEEFLPRLDTILRRCIGTYVPSPENHPPGFEVSGGLDSSTPLVSFAQTHPGAAWHGMTISYTGTRRVTQANKLHAISQYAGSGTLHLIEIEHLNDGAIEKFTTQNPRPFCVIDSAGTKTFDHIAHTFEKAGVTTVFYGIGGDDLFDHNLTAKAQLDIGNVPMQRTLKQLPEFLTDQFRDHLRTLNETDENATYNLPVLSTESSASDPIFNSYINHGIWPVSPFLDGDFYTYCQGLPYKYKHNKHILRAYYIAKKWPAILYDGTYPNEVVEDEFEEPYLSDEFAKIIEEFAAKSIVGHLGYIDPERMLQAYHNIRGGHRAIEPGMFCITLWLNIEHNLRLALRSGQWQPE